MPVCAFALLMDKIWEKSADEPRIESEAASVCLISRT